MVCQGGGQCREFHVGWPKVAGVAGEEKRDGRARKETHAGPRC